MKVNFNTMELAILEEILDIEIPTAKLYKTFTNTSECRKSLTKLSDIGIIRHFISTHGPTVKLTDYGKRLYLSDHEDLFQATNDILGAYV